MRIENDRISDLFWDDVTRLEAEVALAGASAEVEAEAFAYISPSGGERIGLHHEVRDGSLIVNRSGVYEALGMLSSSASDRDRDAWQRWITRADRVKGLQHLQRHIKTMESTPWMQGA